MYNKGGNMLHTIRQIVDNDEEWRQILRGLNQTFWHQTVTGAQVENYISQQAGIDLGPVFDEYLRTTLVPTLEYRLNGTALTYRWTDVVPGFAMPVDVTLGGEGYQRIHPTTEWQTTELAPGNPAAFKVDPDYYVLSKDLAAPPSE
jgi:aminopeptidase N